MNKELSLLGLAKKAGRLAAGGEAVDAALRQGRARLVITASDAAENTLRRVKNHGGSVPHIPLSETGEALGSAIGYRKCVVAALLDEGFAQAFLKARNLPGGKPPRGSSDTKDQSKETNI